MKDRPCLYLIPTPLGNLDDITIRALKILELVDVILCEDTRETGKLLSKYNIKNRLVSCHEYNEDKMKQKVLDFLDSSMNVGLVTDQGTPLISDPGYKVVEFIIENGYNVVSLPGPTAFVPALTVSALPPQPFLFYGFLKSKEGKQYNELVCLKDYPYTMIFYEAPHRLLKTLMVMKDSLGDRKVCVTKEISKKFELSIRGKISTVIEQIDQPKGEFVIVVSGNSDRVDFSDMTIVEHVDIYVVDGMSTNEAIKMVAKERHVPKSVIYKEYHQKKEGE